MQKYMDYKYTVRQNRMSAMQISSINASEDVQYTQMYSVNTDNYEVVLLQNGSMAMSDLSYGHAFSYNY